MPALPAIDRLVCGRGTGGDAGGHGQLVAKVMPVTKVRARVRTQQRTVIARAVPPGMAALHNVQPSKAPALQRN
jgi:cysteine synthase